MITSLITLLILAFVLYVIYYVVGLFIQGAPLQIVGLILGIVLLVKALNQFGIISG